MAILCGFDVNDSPYIKGVVGTMQTAYTQNREPRPQSVRAAVRTLARQVSVCFEDIHWRTILS